MSRPLALDPERPLSDFLDQTGITAYALAALDGKTTQTIYPAVGRGGGISVAVLQRLLGAAGYDLQISAAKRRA